MKQKFKTNNKLFFEFQKQKKLEIQQKLKINNRFWYKKSIWVGYWFELWKEKNAPLVLMVNNNVVSQDFFDYFLICL